MVNISLLERESLNPGELDFRLWEDRVRMYLFSLA